METQDVSVSEHARIDTIILLLLRNLHITLCSVAFQEEYLCEMYKSFVVGSTLGNMSHFEHKKYTSFPPV